MNQGWQYLLQFLILCLMLGIATVIKLNVKFLQKHLIPTSLIAGFLGLVTSIVFEQCFSIIVFDRGFLEKLVYHLMGIGFIALALKDKKSKRNRDIVNTGFAIVNTYAWQGIIGFGISILLIYTVLPTLFPAFGLMLPLSFAQGPGQANNIGSTWEALEGAVPFVNGGNIGLTLATFGFIWAFLGGIPLLNIISRKKRKEKNAFDARKLDNIETDIPPSQHSSTVPKTVYVDDFTLQIVLIGIVYAATYGLLTLLDIAISPLGTYADTLSNLFWGFNFLFGTLMALLARLIMGKLKDKGVIHVTYTDNYLLQRISSTSFDIMITAGIAAISITALRDYLWPVLILTTVGAVFTLIYTKILCRKIYREEADEHTVGLYGMWTGTITTGVALLREIDPDSKSHVSEHLVLGSGVAAVLGIPLMLILNVPITGYLTGRPWMYALTFLLLLLYSAFALLGIYLTNKRYDKIEKNNH